MKRYKRAMLIVLHMMVMAIFTVSVSAQDDPIQQRLDQMTLQQKVGQLFMVHSYGERLGIAGRDLLQTWQPAGVVLFDNNIGTPAKTTRIVNEYQEAMQAVGPVPLFVSTDQEGGWIMRMRDGFTELPSTALITASNNPDLAWRMGQAMAIEISAVGVNMNLAPVADLDTNLANPVIGRRSPGGVPDLVGQMLENYIGGMQSEGVMATVKHFPGHGDTFEDSHIVLPMIPHNIEFLRHRELIPFISAINADVSAIMVAHIWFSAFDAQELPASLSYNIVTGLLRDELGYDGIIMTDAMDMDAIETRYAPDQAAIMAIQAGVDLVVYGTGFSEARQIFAMQGVYDAVLDGRIDESRIDESVYRVLSAKAQYGLMDWQSLEPSSAEARINLAQTTTILPELFDAGVTVAYDNADHVPVAHDESVAVIYPGQRTLITRECGAYHPNIQWLPVSNAPTSDEIASAVAVAGRVNTVIVFTRNASETSSQVELVRALPPEKTVAVALYSPYDGVLFPQTSGYIITYAPQDPGISTVCRILFGVSPARGQLSITLTAPPPS
ncbi:MAG TPA: glycoside hydrolase family 3 protein [Aggregatilineales bacterium]|nr:glycoside hydrolase family 3 protein [Aggregatilineales bacterium]